MAKNKKRAGSHKKHCNSKIDVLRMVANQIEQKQPQRPKNRLRQQLYTINTLRPVMETARKKMRKEAKEC